MGLRRLALNAMLRAARRALAGAPTPETMRREVQRAGRLVALREPMTLSIEFPLGGRTAHWVDAPGSAQERVILYLHGGAFIAESPAIHNPLLAALCRASDARGLMVNYRLAPEHPFPAASDDCLAGYRYLIDSGFDPARIVIAGDSAGGNLAVVTALRARDAALPRAAGMVLLSPILDASFSGDSMQRNDGIDPLFRASTIQGFAKYYGASVDRRHPWLSPLRADRRDLPPALLLAGSSELLLDDSVRYATTTPGTELSIWHGMPHVFPAVRGLPEGAQALRLMGAWIRARTAPAAAAGG